MPPKKKKKQSRKTTQSQRQSQKVIVNIGSKSKPRKKSGRGGLPPPSYQHNLAPTFITTPQVDYTPLLLSLTQQTRSLQPEPVQNPVTPLSSTTQTVQQMAGDAAIRRAEESDNFEVVRERTKDKPFVDPYGYPEPVVKSVETLKQEFAYLAQQESLKARRAGPTAANFQPMPSEADERLAQQVQDYDDVVRREAFERKIRGRRETQQTGQQQAEEAIGLVQQALQPKSDYAGGGIPIAESRAGILGRPPKGLQVATLINPAEEPRQATGLRPGTIQSFLQKQSDESKSKPLKKKFISASQEQTLMSQEDKPVKQQTAQKSDIKDIVDQKLKSGEQFTQAEMSKAMQKSTKIGKTRAKALVKAGYTQFEIYAK